MKISLNDRVRMAYQADRLRLQHQRDEDYSKIVDRRKYDKMVADRVQRNIRLGLDKGQNVDMEC
jgi:hypothetical protein